MHDLAISGNAVLGDAIENITVLITGSTIEKISERNAAAKQSITLTDTQLLFPGFIDPHVHLREPGWEYKEDFRTGSEAALHGGVTTVGDMPNLPEPIVTKERLLRKRQLARKAHINVLHYGGVGRIDDIREMAPLVPAFKIYTAESTGDMALSWGAIEMAVAAIVKHHKPIIFHCEDPAINEHAKRSLRNKYPEQHCDERPPESEIAAVQRVAALCKKYNARGHVAHISTAEGVKIAAEHDMTCEVTPHHLFFKKQDMRTKGNLLKMNPPLRPDSERRALLRALKSGRIGMLATDHAPHTLDEKISKGPSGVPGLDTYGLFVSWLIEQGFAPEQIGHITSGNAARFLGLADRGVLAEGMKADLTILNTKAETVVDKNDLDTKCGWSPFEGVRFPGRVACTIRNGAIRSAR